jgi:ParB-like chromosome segregation protein Spo0J
MKVESVSIEKLVPYARNPRINAHLVDEVAASIKEFGFQQNIVVDSEMVIVVGHVRYMAAQKLGMKEVPVSVMKGVSKAKVRAYRIADNKLGEKSQWDNQLLHLEIGELVE